MTDDELDVALRAHLLADGPDPAVAKRIVGSTRTSGRWVWNVALALAAGLTLALVVWGPPRPATAPEAAAPAAPAPVSIPDGLRSVQLDRGSAALPVQYGDRVSVLLTQAGDVPETMTLATGALAMGGSPPELAVPPELAERLVYAMGVGALTLVGERGAERLVAVHATPGPAAVGDHVDVLLTRTTPTGVETRTVLQDVPVSSVLDGAVVLAAPDGAAAEVLVHADHLGSVSLLPR
jgi:hypothetical protein